jgi:multidrug resistance protein, MATE family
VAATLSRRFTRLAAINVASNLLVPLAGLVDVAILGHLDSVRHLAGVALGAVIFDYLLWTVGFLRMGTVGPTARADGQGDRVEVLAILVRGLAVAIVLGGALLATAPWLADLGFAVLDGATDVEASGRAYVRARFWGVPSAAASMVLLGWFLGQDQAGKALVMTAVGSVSNMALDMWFVWELGWGAEGAGWATAASQTLTLASGLLLAAPALQGLGPVWVRARDAQALRELAGLSRDIVVRSFFLVTVFAAFTSLAAGMGTLVLAGSAVLMKLLGAGAWLIDGYAFATETLAGQADGAGDRRTLRQVLGLSLGASLATGLLLAGGLVLAPGVVLGVLTDQPAVLAEATRHVTWLLPVLGVGSMAYALDGYFIGLTAGRTLRRAMAVSAVLGFVPLATWAWHLGDPTWLWAALAVFMVARVITLGIAVPGTLRDAASRSTG